MIIGDMRMDGLIDGEIVVPGPTFYTATNDTDWRAHPEFLEPVTGRPEHLNTLGDYPVRYADRVFPSRPRTSRDFGERGSTARATLTNGQLLTRIDRRTCEVRTRSGD